MTGEEVLPKSFIGVQLRVKLISEMFPHEYFSFFILQKLGLYKLNKRGNQQHSSLIWLNDYAKLSNHRT